MIIAAVQSIESLSWRFRRVRALTRDPLKLMARHFNILKRTRARRQHFLALRTASNAINAHMIFSRINTALKRQGWFTVLVELLVVAIGSDARRWAFPESFQRKRHTDHGVARSTPAQGSIATG
ncbi:MAG: hypothetical protein ACLFQ2_06060 [Wenzhouxiangella sp.]